LKSFKEFVMELHDVPVVSIEKTQVELDEPETVNEINKNLQIVLSKDFANIGEGLNACKKILTMYGIELPQINFKDQNKGKILVNIGQFKSSGENHHNITGPFQERNEHHTFTFTYELINGSYDVHAEVKQK